VPVTLDLTKLDQARKHAALAAAVGCVLTPFPLPILGPLISLVETLIKKPGQLDKDDAQYVTEIIQKGAQSGVDELEIIVDRETALGVDLKLGKARGKQPFNFTIGQRGATHYEIRVKYRTSLDSTQV